METAKKTRIQFKFPQWRVEKVRQEVGPKGLSAWLDDQLTALQGKMKLGHPVPETLNREFLTRMVFLAQTYPSDMRILLGDKQVTKLQEGINLVQWMTDQDVEAVAKTLGVGVKDLGAMLMQMEGDSEHIRIN